MTISSTTTRQDYTGDGATVAFAFTFKTHAAAHVQVLLAGVVQSSGYTVALNADQDASPGGTVTFLAAPLAGVTVRIQRVVPLTQGVNLAAHAAFPAETLERALDLAVMVGQQTQRDVDDNQTSWASDKAAQDALIALKRNTADQAAKDAQQDALIADTRNMASAGVGDAATVLATGSTTARTLAARHADVVNVKDFGAVGDGVTDDTSAVAAALAASTAIHFPHGTYLINTVTVATVADISLADGATLKHKSASTDHMILFTGTRLSIRGGSIDGNRAGQGTNRRYAIRAEIPHTAVVEASGVKFTGTQAAGVAGFTFGGALTVQDCRFVDMAEHDGIDGHFTAAVYVGSGESGYRGLCRFNRNALIGTNSPANVGGAPGGIFFAPTLDYLNGIGNFSTLEAMGNYFWGIGQNCAVNDIGPIHTYPSTDGVRVIGNYFEQSGFSAIAAKSVQNFVCIGNTVINGQVNAKNAPAEGAISYAPGYHSGSTARPRAVISGNIVDTPGGDSTTKQTGIAVIGQDTSLASDVVISDNVIAGCGIGISVDRAVDVTIRGNKIQGATGGVANTETGIKLDHVMSGVARIVDNDITAPNGYGIYALQSINTSTVIVDNNRIDHSTVGSYAVLVRGAAVAKFSGNIVSSTAGAYSLTTDGTNPIGLLAWDTSNRVMSGTLGIVFASITSVVGHMVYPNDPEALVAAPVGTLYTRTTTGVPALYVKATGTGNTGWRSVSASSIGSDRGDVDATLVSTDHRIQRWTGTLTANRTVTLSTASARNGDAFRVVRTGLGAFTLDVGPGVKVIPAGTAAFVDVVYNGSAWVLTGYGTL